MKNYLISEAIGDIAGSAYECCFGYTIFTNIWMENIN